MTKMEKKHFNWQQFQDSVYVLTKLIAKDKITYDGIYAVPRGGLVLGVALSHRLGLPLLLWPTKNSLVVDDISDSGKTLENINNKKIATLHYKIGSLVEPDYYVHELKRNSNWVDYPWEV